MQNLRRQFDKDNEQDNVDYLMACDFLEIFEIVYSKIETDKTVTVIVPVERIGENEQTYAKHRLADNYGFYIYESDDGYRPYESNEISGGGESV